MTIPEFMNFMAGFAAFHGAKGGEAAPSDEEYLAALADEIQRSNGG